MHSEGIIIPTEDVAASFQQAVVDVLAAKTFAAAEEYRASHIIVAGGVSANNALRKAMTVQKKYTVHIPPLKLCTDNAAMIGAAGYFRFIHGHSDALDFDVLPTWPLV